MSCSAAILMVIILSTGGVSGTVIYHSTGLYDFLRALYKLHVNVRNWSFGSFLPGVQNSNYKVCNTTAGGSRHLKEGPGLCHFPFRNELTGTVHTACTNESADDRGAPWCYHVQEPDLNNVWDGNKDWGICGTCVPQSGNVCPYS